MDAKSIGEILTILRKKAGLTQLELSKKLNVSDKTVSRWENGLGYPEITQFPALAEIFGVTVDYLISGNRKGMAIAGNIIIDAVKLVDCYPKISMLANISDVINAVGGCAPNTAIDIAKMDPSIPLSVLGKIGNDENGKFVVEQMKKHGINCDNVKISLDQPTSFSDVITCPDGERTFFHAAGANAQFCPDDINLSALNCRMLHIGYIFLLKCFDADDKEYGTVMARFLHDAQAAGIKTSVDVVSDSTGNYKQKIIPALKYCNYIILNETESSMISDLEPYYPDGRLNIENIKATMKLMASYGVKEKVIVHCKAAGFCYNVETDEFNYVASVNIPKSEIKGSVGAGDAFCAGCLYGIYNGYSDVEILDFASSAAACNLFSENSIDGMRTKAEIEKMVDIYGRETLRI